MLPGNHGLDVAAQIEIDIAPLDALYHAGNHFADPVLIGLDHLGPLGLAHLLHDDLLGGLGGNAAEGHGLDRLFDVIPDGDVRLLIDGIHVPELIVGRLHLHIVRDHFPTAEGLVIPRAAIDGDPHVDLLKRTFLGGRGQRGLQSLENNFFLDALLVGNRVHHQ